MRHMMLLFLLAAALPFAACGPVDPPTFPDPGPGQPFDCAAELAVLDGTSPAAALRTEAPRSVRRVQAPVAGRYIVVMRPPQRDASGAAIRTTAQAYSALQSRHTMTEIQALPSIRGYACSMSAQTAAAVAQEPDVLFVEEEGRKTIPTPVPNTGDVSGISPAAVTRIVNLDRADQRDLPLDGDYTQPVDAAGIDGFVVDTGICATHPDFQGRVGEGFSSQPGSPEDRHGHGCHVAGTMAGGQFGMADGMTVHGVRVLDAQGSGTDSQVIQGIDWVTDYVTEHELAGKAVANFSLGGDTSDALDLALCRMMSAGVEVAVAAGNDGLDACDSSPARVLQAVTVAAANPRNDNAASFSNIGGCVDVWGDGVDITSARLGGGETVLSGTSMASPQAAGSLGLVLKLHPEEDAKAHLLALATPDKIRGDIPNTANRRLYVEER